jgi:hypothetical protein
VAFFAEKTAAQKLSQRLDPIPIHAPDRMGQLVGVASSLYRQGRGDEGNRVIHCYAQPEIIVFANLKTFVESPYPIKEFLGQHSR